MKKYNNISFAELMKMHHGIPISRYELAEILGKHILQRSRLRTYKQGSEFLVCGLLTEIYLQIYEFLSLSVTVLKQFVKLYKLRKTNKFSK